MILINVAEPKRMGMISRYSAVTLPVSVGVLAGYLLSKDRKVKIVDELINPVDKSFSIIRDYLKNNNIEKPYIFGISCLTININRGLEIARLIKLNYPDAIIIFGGIHPTVLPEESLNTDFVDIVVRGEGEDTLLLLYDAIRNKSDYSDISGISFREGLSIRNNPDRQLIENLDDISFFPYELFDANQYNLGFIITSRGCPYSCIFCSQRRISGRKYRFRSCENVIKEIDLLVNRYHQRTISFLDDNFLVNKERVKLLCKLIIQNKLHRKANFTCQARADNINEEILGYLKESGFSSIGLGIETGSERLMQIINKGETVAENIRAVKLIRKIGFTTSAFFMFGLPSETKYERFQTYMLAKDLKLKYVKFNNIVPYPGTKLYEIAKIEGTLNIEKNWKNFNSVGGIVEGIFSKFKPPYIPCNNTEAEFKKDLIRANLYFYLSRPHSLLSLLRRENKDWFSLSQKWYLSLWEYYYLIKLAIRVAINAAAVFSIRWFIDELRWCLGDKKFNIDRRLR